MQPPSPHRISDRVVFQFLNSFIVSSKNQKDFKKIPQSPNSTMSFLASSLSGSWTGGTKTTRKGRYSTHVTESVWENTRLEFEITEEQKDVIVIKGNGETVWKSRQIPFMIDGVGLIASPTRVDISIIKRHKGMKREIDYENLVLNPMART